MGRVCEFYRLNSMNKNSTKAVIFDGDGTLWRPTGADKIPGQIVSIKVIGLRNIAITT